MPCRASSILSAMGCKGPHGGCRRSRRHRGNPSCPLFEAPVWPDGEGPAFCRSSTMSRMHLRRPACASRFITTWAPVVQTEGEIDKLMA